MKSVKIRPSTIRTTARRITTTVAFTVCASLLAVGVAAPANPAAKVGPQKTLQTVFASAQGKKVLNETATLVADPSTSKAIVDVLQQYGSAGQDILTDYEQGLLETGLDVTLTDPDIFKAELTGKKLTAAQKKRNTTLRTELAADPVVTTLSDEGSDLQQGSKGGGASAELIADVRTVVDEDTAKVPGPIVTDGAGGSAGLDSVIGHFETLRQSAAYTDVMTQLKPTLRSTAYADMVADADPLEAATYLPDSELATQETGSKTSAATTTAATAITTTAAQGRVVRPACVAGVVLGILGMLGGLVLIAVSIVGALPTAGGSLAAMLGGLGAVEAGYKLTTLDC